MQLAPTMHGAILKVTYGENVGNREPKRVCFRQSQFRVEGDLIIGTNRRVGSDRIPVRNFEFHIVASATTNSGAKVELESQGSSMACFKTTGSFEGGVVMEVRIATSLISQKQAQLNLKRELPNTEDYTIVAAKAKQVWNELLRRVDVVDAGPVSERSSRHLSVFYTGLARGLAFPRRLDEVDENGKIVHYSPYSSDGGVRDGILVTDNGFWDTYRTVYPMLSLLYPDHLGNIVQGWLNAYREGGWLPSWASPGYRNCMVGTFADVVVADAVVKQVPGFDHVTAYDALIKDSYSSPPPGTDGAVGKEGLNEYDRHGFLPSSPSGHDSVSRTLDYGFSDFAAAQAFEKLSGDATFRSKTSKTASEITSKAVFLKGRALKAHNSLYSKARGLMVPKDASGREKPGFNPLAWGFGYTEGNAWHHSFPPYQLDSLVKLHGGKENLRNKLLELIKIPSNFQAGSYGQEIHEMTEARAFAMGQYMHNNQPVHHILYMFAALGYSELTNKYVREVMERGYGYDFYAGDEDNGEQGAWYVLSALGLFGLVPGTPDYVTGSPIFPHVTIARSPGQATVAPLYVGDNTAIHTGTVPTFGETAYSPLHIIARGTDAKNVHVEGLILNNEPVTTHSVSDEVLQKPGTVLRFVMEGEGYTPTNAKSFYTTSIALLQEIKEGQHDQGSSHRHTEHSTHNAPVSNGLFGFMGAGSASVGKDLETTSRSAPLNAKDNISIQKDTHAEAVEMDRMKNEFKQREAMLEKESQHQRGVAEALQHRLDVLEQKLRTHPASGALVGGGSGSESVTSASASVDPYSSSMIALDICVAVIVFVVMAWAWYVGAGWKFNAFSNLWRSTTATLPFSLPFTNRDKTPSRVV